MEMLISIYLLCGIAVAEIARSNGIYLKWWEYLLFVIIGVPAFLILLFGFTKWWIKESIKEFKKVVKT